MCKLAWERKCKYPHKIEDLYCREGRMCKSWPNCKARHFDSDVEYLRSQRPDSEKRLGIGKDENRAEKIKKLEKQEDPWMRKAKVARDERCEREEREERERRERVTILSKTKSTITITKRRMIPIHSARIR